MAQTTVGTIELKAVIDTGAYKRGANEIDRANKKIEGSTSRADSGLAKLARNGLKTAVVGFGALATVIAGMTIKGGISRALNIEDAQAKLRGLGHDVKSIEDIMTSALDSVRGTAYGLDAAATIAAGAVAAGVKPGQDLTKYLSLAGDAATIAGTSLDEMGSIFGKVQTQQRAYTMELNQLADRGIPIYQWLQKELGVTQETLRDMVSKGEVDSKTYFKVIKDNIGGAALESGKTTRGAWANTLAAMSRVGQQIVQGPINQIREGFGTLTRWIDANANTIVSTVQDVMKWFVSLGHGFVAVATQVGDYLGPKLTDLWTTLSTKLFPALMKVWKEAIVPMLPVIGTALVAAVGLAVDIVNGLAQAVTWLITEFQNGNPFVYALAAAFVTFAGVKGVMAAVGAVNTLRTVAIPKAIVQLGLLKAAVMTPMIMPAIVVAAALAAIGLVLDAAEKAKSAIENLRETRARNAEIEMDAMRKSKAQLDRGEISREQHQRNLQILGRAKGGPVSANTPYFVGENPDGSLNKTSELFVPNSSGRIVSSKDLQGMMGGGIENNINSIVISNEVDGERWLRRLTDNSEIVSHGLVPQQQYMGGA